MREKKRLTPPELAAIEEHCGKQLAAAERHVERLTAVVRRTGDRATAKHLQYYQNYVSAMRHSIGVARQRAVEVQVGN